jgi:4,5-dihydroxyphthalate decarboxylase
MLIEQYGISPARVIWIVPGPPAQEIQPRDGSKLKFIERTAGLDDKSLLEEALVAGGIDCMAAATFSSAFLKGDTRVARLFGDYKEQEVFCHKETGSFPIMHVLVAKRSLVERHPDLSQRLVALFSRAQAYARERLHSEGSLSLAWKNHYLEEEEHF